MTRRLVCVGFATSLDRYALLSSLRIAAVNRPEKVFEQAGGKAFNAARAAARLGVSVRTIALIGGPAGAAVETLADREGLDFTFVPGTADTRQCTCLLDQTSGDVTEIYEPVLDGSPDDVAGMLAAALADLQTMTSADLLALSGRLAPGHNPDTLARLVLAAQQVGVPVLIDSDGDPLLQALRPGPDLVKVNRTEAARVTGLDEQSALQDLAHQLTQLGARTAIVTDGSGGAVAMHGPEWAHLAPAPIPRAAAVGSGDAFVAGLAAGILARTQRQHNLHELLRDGIAAARANARNFLAGSVDRASWMAEQRSLADVSALG